MTAVAGTSVFRMSSKPPNTATRRGTRISRRKSCRPWPTTAVAPAAVECSITTPAGPSRSATECTPATGAAARCSSTTPRPTVPRLTRTRKRSSPSTGQPTSMSTAAAGCTSQAGRAAASATATRTSVLSSSSRRKTINQNRSPMSLNSVTGSFTPCSPARVRCKTCTPNSRFSGAAAASTAPRHSSNSPPTQASRSPDGWLRFSLSSSSTATRQRPICSSSVSDRTLPSLPSAHSLTARANSTAWRLRRS